MDGGWLHAKALQQSRLHYTDASLARLDALMAAIRERAQPSRAALVDTPQGRNFCALVAFYLIAMVVRRTGAHVAWHELDTAEKLLPPGPALPRGSMSRLVAWAPDQGRVFLPLAWPEGRLLTEVTPSGATEFVDDLVAQLNEDAPVVWWTAAQALGILASSIMSFVADGSPVPPRLMLPGADDGVVFVSLMFDDQDDALENGRARLRANADGLPWMAFGYRAWANLPGGRTEAVAVEVRAFGDQPLDLVVAFPFRHAADGQPFAILERAIGKTNATDLQLKQLQGAIERGLLAWNWPFGGSWKAHREAGRAAETGGLASAPAQARTPPSYATGERVQAGDAVLSDAGFFPARIVDVRDVGSGNLDCIYEDCHGDLRVLPGAQAADFFVRVRPGVADRAQAAAAGVAWLERQVQHGGRAKGVNAGGPAHGAMLSAAHARHALGNLYWQGLCVPRDIGLALRAWQAAADSGYAPAECEIGRIHLRDGAVRADPFKASNYLTRAASKGDARAQALLAEACESGRLGSVDLAQAVDLYTRAAAAGNASAMRGLAGLHREGRGVARDGARALALLTQSAEAGDAQAQYELGLVLTEGELAPQDYAQCVRWYELSAAQGHRGAINNLADKLEHGLGVAQDLARAIALYRQAADMNISAAWYSLGKIAAEGRGMARDLDEAVRRMTVAAEHGFSDAAALLATYRQAQDAARGEAAQQALADAAGLDPVALYELASATYDPAVPSTMPPAFALFMKAADGGHAESQFQVGFRYRRGLGVAADPAKAMAWFERAAAAGNGYAKETLGELHETGEFGPRDPALAFRYTLEAAESGQVMFAHYRLARMYEDGRGTPADPVQALRWMKMAARTGHADATRRAAALEERLKQAQAGPASPRKPGWKFW
ncbi:MAG TPA: tetratricopeptide repeat protein [Burkholderiaceae bacterium]